VRTRPWKVTTVQEFVDKGEAELKTGPFGTQLHASDYVDEGTPVINVRNIGFGSVVPEKLEFLDVETVARLEGHLLQRKDIVFGRKGAVERHAFIRDEQHGWFQGSDCLRLRIRSSELNPRFLSYTFLTESHKQWMMNQCSHGATMASLNQAIICRIPLRLPEIGTQNRIADILSAYDGLIESNTRRINILEQMAQMLHREWFVNFRFPGHAKIKMVESELGAIPQGWGVESVGTTSLNFDSRRRPLSSMERATRKGPYPYYGAAKVFDYIDDFIFDGVYLLVGEDGSVITPDRKPVLQLTDGRFWPNNHTHVLRGKAPISTSYLFLVLSDADVSGCVTGAAQPKITQANLNRIPVMVATERLMNKFDAVVAPMFSEVATLNRKNINLRSTRDMLLPKLVSGEVSVEQIEKEAIAQMV
jgi:type I restriction enzyme, S subunit